jgi:hypothetical protein
VKSLAQFWAVAPPSLRARNASALDAQRRAACPPSERAALDATTAKRARAVSAATAAQSAGQCFEAVLAEHHGCAWARGLARVVKQHVPTVQRRAGVLLRTAKGDVDYLGTLRGGRLVAIEAKSAGTGRLALVEPTGAERTKHQHTGLRAHQAAALTAYASLGALALLVVRFVRRPRGIDVATVYAVPWVEIAHLNDIGPDDVSAHAVSGDCYLARYVEAL